MDQFSAQTLALRALAWIVADPALGPRLLALTGLDPAGLRERAGEPALLGATIDFLTQHEPTLIACAEALETKPETLVAARGQL